MPRLICLLFLALVCLAPVAHAQICTVANDCNSRATSVTYTGGQCVCGPCRNQWSGSQCQLCPVAFNQADDCGSCNTPEMYGGTYPNCVSLACTQTDCNNRAVAVTGNRTAGCVCYCQNQWQGNACQTCPAGLDSTSNCGACLSGYTGYPSCSLACTNGANCSSHADAVYGTTATNCTCLCLNLWSGPTCSNCPQYVSTTTTAQCGACIAGYEGYPTCVLTCTTAANCSSHASTVSGNSATGCNCSCQNRWSGSTCNVCPYGFEQTNCGACITGYSGYPNCAQTCTAATDCNNKGTASGTYATGCTCKCQNFWTAASNCSVCPLGYDASQSCSVCASGYTGLPNCTRSCSVTTDCSGNAYSVSGSTYSGCVCNCRYGWSGSNCSVCPANSGGTDCNTCVAGYTGTPPSCVKACTLAADCGTGATQVTGTSTGCVCTCRNAWSGSKCNVCPSNYSSTIGDCDTCNAAFEIINFTCTLAPPACPCELTCTNTNNCSGRASAVTGNGATGCNCTCRNQYTGPTCSTCPDKYGGSQCNVCGTGYGGTYPNCTLLCTLTDCSGRATSVSGVKGSCVCVCANQWTGANCSTCPARFSSTSSFCASCASGYDTYPFCYKSCTVANCSSHALTVVGNNNTGCNCTCRNQWYGAICLVTGCLYNSSKNCGACDNGYTGYPNCVRSCTSEVDCNDHAVNASGTIGNCTCNCRNKWSDATCSTCPALYNATQDCGACVQGRDTYPSCYLTCTVASNCSSHATNVTGNTFKGCSCSCLPQWNGSAICSVCANNWTGTNCDQCPVNYNASKNCGACESGYVGYPNCVRSCTSATDCNDHASSAGGTVGNCTCNCRNKWRDATCSTCPALYNSSQDCGTCVDGRDTYPSCYLTCTVASNCSSHATNVTGNTNTGCNCSCTTYSNCAACNAGYSGTYPDCTRTCEPSDCFNHSTAVTGRIPNCVCTCRNGWTASSLCAQCPLKYNASDDCGSCNECPLKYNASDDCGSCNATTHDGTFPNCYLRCTVAANCSDHADSVTGDTSTGCSCNCRNNWTTLDCSTCPAHVNASKDCGTCDADYEQYPLCLRTCTSVTDCNNHAANVSGTAGACTCNCRNQWSDATCSTCPALYNSTKDCGVCITGRDSYPSCYLTCTTAANCTSHATNVTGNTNTGCHCSCQNRWTSDACDVCPEFYNASMNCGACVAGYTGYPNCVRSCTPIVDCNDHATTAGGTIGNCTCNCRNKWSDATCSTCPALYNASQDCGACVQGRDTYPSCYLTCTVTSNCSSHGTNVTGNTHTGCACACLPQWNGTTSCSACANNWTGTNCDQCPTNYNASKNCGACDTGYVGYPNCVRSCTPDADCNGNAVTAGGTVGHCTCNCRNKWSDATCSTCPALYNSSKDCGVCVDGRDTYPSCYLTCTVASNCSAHATNVTGNTNTGCNCSCTTQWGSQDCSYCPSPYDANSNCAACNPNGFGGDYPNCRRVCDAVLDCNSNAVNATGVTPNCTCYCRNQWSGAACTVCPVAYNSNNDCGSCATSYVGTYPQCYLGCNLVDNCNSHANTVTGNTYNGCNCSCRNQWNGSTCGVCPPLYNASLDCGVCIRGYVNYPQCDRSCTNAIDCNGNALSVSGTAGNCVCVCKNQWSTGNCSVCPSNFALVNGSSDTCSTCAAGYDSYPACYLTCTTASNCSAHATTVSGNTNTGCNCTCRNQWHGDSCTQCPSNIDASQDCGVCAAAYDDYPSCYLTCTMSANCSGHAEAVSGNTNTGCTCFCRNEWSNKTCNTCATRFNISVDCGTCAEGYTNYPACPRVCTNDADCGGHASSVSGLYPNCQCTCRNSWSAASNCSTCPAQYDPDYDCYYCNVGYTGVYPTCYADCTIASACNGNANEVSGTVVTGCNCTCRNQWISVANATANGNTTQCNYCPSNFDSAAGCGACAATYVDYPICKQLCTPDTDCNGHADTATGYRPNCTCNCRNQWYGNSCNSCAKNFSATNDCGTCTGGYEDYPKCYFACTTAANCSNHASGVSGNDAVGCLCECRNAWSSVNCSVCPANTDESNDCASCLPNFYGYPRCRRQCTNALDCNGRADSFSGLEGDCICTCRNAYDPLTNCSTCPTGFNASTDCASCSNGYEDYPHCYRICTVGEDCSGNAASVTGNLNTTCQCHCSNQWFGDNCSLCDAKFDQATCAACAVGYEGYPNCSLSCTIAANCSGQASSVTGTTATGCVCHCLDQWSGDSCTTCPALYNASNGCESCAAGFDTYPSCYQSCTMANCTAGSTRSVSGNSHTGCVCHCLNAYSDPTCSTCAANFSAGGSCGSCAAGYDTYPYCYRTCTLTTDCDGNAVSVTGNDNTGCVCQCRNRWSGPHCATCTGNYEPGNDCSSCAYGYENYPSCYQTCTALNCSNQGTASGNSNTSCSCACLGGWLPPTCSTCPANFNVTMNCMTCAAGFENYPYCYASCTSADCNNRGVASGNRVNGCSCQCRNAWYGSYCQYCPGQYDAQADCYACAAGYYGTYPYCTNPSNSTNGGNSTSGTVQGCGSYTEHVTGTWTPGSSVTAATSLKDAETIFNTYLQQVGCGSSCSRGYLVSRVGGNSFTFDITVSSTTAATALTIANCYNGIMNNGSYWPGIPPSDSQWPNDPDYFYGCQHGLFNWSYCESWCYYLYEHGNYSCCTWWYNRCYHYNCSTSSVSCDINFSGASGGYNVTVNGTCELDPVCKKRVSKWVWGSGTPSPSLTISETLTLTSSATPTINPLLLSAPDLRGGPLSGGALWGLIGGIIAALLLCFLVLLYFWRKRTEDRTGAGRGRRYTKSARTLEDLRHRADSKFVFDELLGEDELGRVAANIEEDASGSSDELNEVPINASVVIPPPPSSSTRPTEVRLPPPPVKHQAIRFDDI
ncbi:membrane-associated protein, putative [Bodo saltans]|uniref:Membrane-associated protein, putative n=1 Tax=Bodo saltans TaxID=75058 RepID=A0A0S4ILX3_BODSA|nr:membrane-associated protein, putative [Bodo saltans]|eukprot:CUE71031.1 membrane-associated protein, putative [Bodo saltans]